MDIKRKTFQIQGQCEYFQKKYGTFNPVITIEDRVENLMGKDWKMMMGNPAVILFNIRMLSMLTTDLPEVGPASENLGKMIAKLNKDYPNPVKGMNWDDLCAVYYGKIDGMGELVNGFELTEKV